MINAVKKEMENIEEITVPTLTRFWGTPKYPSK
jgi:hypothetical protein